MTQSTKELDEDQRAVVEHSDGALLVLGGPGTGKTKTLEHRYLRLAELVAPHRVLLLCNSRAYSMGAKNQLARQLPQRATIEVPVYTWHALAYHLVTRYYPSLGYSEAPVLLTASEQWGAVSHLMRNDRARDWGSWKDRKEERAFVDEVADFCIRVQQQRRSPAEVAEFGEVKPEWAPVVAFYGRYQEYLKRESRLDYAGLINAATDLLIKDGEVRQTLHNRFPHVMVDDAQEVSGAGQALLKQLDTSNLVVTADPDSGIESFRGAEADWIYNFEQTFGGSTAVLPRSYRLGPIYIKGALRLIDDNDPKAKHRFTHGGDHETAGESRLYSSVAEEADAVATELRTLHLQAGVPWNAMAVLLSQPSQLLGPLAEALKRREVPFDSPSRERPVTSEPSVAAFLDLLKVAGDSEDREQLVKGILTSPLGGLTFADRRRLERTAWSQGRSFLDMIEGADEAKEFRKLRDLAGRNLERIDECFWQIYQASSYYRRIEEEAKADPAADANGVLDALVAFSHSLGRFVERRHGRGTASDYLNEAVRADFGGDPWLKPQGGSDSAVAVTTFHGSAGRQWDVVVVMGCLDAWIPKGRRAQGLFDPFALQTAKLSEREVEAIAEDRRTFYVAATRASQRVLFTVAPKPGGNSQPSRFLTDLFGKQPEKPEVTEPPPLTFAELRAHLRRVLEAPSADSSEKIAAAVALAETPGTNPSRWYWRWPWTEGATPLIDGEFVTSYTRLGVYENCGLQYLLQSVLGLDSTSTHSMKFGSWIHQLFDAIGKGKLLNRKQLDAAYDDVFDASLFPTASVARNYRRYGSRILDNFCKHEMTQPILETEYPFKDFKFSGATFRGFIDRIGRIGESNLVLTDYKTSRSAVSRDEAGESLQLAIYMLFAQQDEKLMALGKPVKARLVYPGQTWASGDIIERVQVPEQTAKVAQEKLPKIIESAKAEDFRPRPEADCRWCQMKPLCPLWHGKEVGS